MHEAKMKTVFLALGHKDGFEVAFPVMRWLQRNGYRG